MAGVVVGHPALERGLDARHAEHVHEELRQLVGLLREGLGRGLERRIVLEESRVLRLDHPRAGARGHDHVLGSREEPDGPRGDDGGVVVIAGVEERHPAAGLPLGKVHRHAQAPQEPDHGHAHLGEEHVAETGDHERGLHRLRLPRRRRGGRRRHHHQDEQRIGAVVEEAVLDSGRGDERLARRQPLLLAAEREAPGALEHVVDLVLVAVRVGLLVLAGRHAVEIELGALRRRQRDLGHPRLVELDVILDPDLHVSLSARARRSTGWTTSSSTPSSRACLGDLHETARDCLPPRRARRSRVCARPSSCRAPRPWRAR